MSSGSEDMRQARRATEQPIWTIADWMELGRTAVQIGGYRAPTTDA